MIKFLFYVVLFLSFIVIQTSFLPHIPIFSNIFDILLIFVLFLSLMYANFFIIIPIIIIGLCMDSISDAPFGFYMITYLWIFIIVHFLKKFVHRGNIIFIPCISAFSVVIQNSFLFFSFFINYGNDVLSSDNLIAAGKQAVWAFFLIPVCIVIIHGINILCEKLDAKGIV